MTTLKTWLAAGITVAMLVTYELSLLWLQRRSPAMAVRYYDHAGFVLSMPVESDERHRRGRTAVAYLRRAGLLYSWSLRHLLMVAPLLAFIVYPLAGPMAAALVVAALFAFDRFQT